MLKKVTTMEAKDPRIFCTYGDGEVVEYDLADVLSSDGEVALSLRDPAFFAQVFLESGVPTWPNGMCVCADEIYRNGRRLPSIRAS